jgi:hypothetical protein
MSVEVKEEEYFSFVVHFIKLTLGLYAAHMLLIIKVRTFAFFF